MRNLLLGPPFAHQLNSERRLAGLTDEWEALKLLYTSFDGQREG